MQRAQRIEALELELKKEQARTAQQVEANKDTRQALDKVLAALAKMYEAKGYCEKYAWYLAYCDGSMYKEMSAFLDLNQDVEWTTRLKKKKE